MRCCPLTHGAVGRALTSSMKGTKRALRRSTRAGSTVARLSRSHCAWLVHTCGASWHSSNHTRRAAATGAPNTHHRMCGAVRKLGVEVLGREQRRPNGRRGPRGGRDSVRRRGRACTRMPAARAEEPFEPLGQVHVAVNSIIIASYGHCQVALAVCSGRRRATNDERVAAGSPELVVGDRDAVDVRGECAHLERAHREGVDTSIARTRQPTGSRSELARARARARACASPASVPVAATGAPARAPATAVAVAAARPFRAGLSGLGRGRVRPSVSLRAPSASRSSSCDIRLTSSARACSSRDPAATCAMQSRRSASPSRPVDVARPAAHSGWGACE